MSATRTHPWTWVLAAVTGCTVAPVDLDGKRCPCADGWVCDEASDRCRTADAGTGVGSSDVSSGISSSEGSSAVPDSTTAAASTTVEPTGDPSGQPVEDAFTVVSFAADWSTPNAIHWRWEVQGEASDFRAYEVWIADTAAAVDDPATAVVFDGDVNPELDRFELRNSGDADLVEATITDALSPGTEYFARLHVLDTAGGRTTSANVAVRSTTAAPIDGVVVFGDESPFPPGYPLPACYVRSDAAPYGGTTHHFELAHFCSAGGTSSCIEADTAEPECWENLRWEGLEVAIAQLDAGDFTDAYLELAIAVDPPGDAIGHGWWSTVGVRVGDQNRSFSPLTIRADGEYRLVQVPLAQMGTTHAELAGQIQGARVGSTWHTGSVIRVDEAWIRW